MHIDFADVKRKFGRTSHYLRQKYILKALMSCLSWKSFGWRVNRFILDIYGHFHWLKQWLLRINFNQFTTVIVHRSLVCEFNNVRRFQSHKIMTSRDISPESLRLRKRHGFFYALSTSCCGNHCLVIIMLSVWRIISDIQAIAIDSSIFEKNMRHFLHVTV